MNRNEQRIADALLEKARESEHGGSAQRQALENYITLVRASDLREASEQRAKETEPTWVSSIAEGLRKAHEADDQPPEGETPEPSGNMNDGSLAPTNTDQERLDWLSRFPGQIRFDGRHIFAAGIEETQLDYRGAIDAAMEQMRRELRRNGAIPVW